MQFVLTFDREWLIRLSTAYANVLRLKSQRLHKKGLLWQWGTTFDSECKKKPVGCLKPWLTFTKMKVRRFWSPPWHERAYALTYTLGQMFSLDWLKNLVTVTTNSVTYLLDWFNCLVKMFSKIKRPIVRRKDKTWIRLSSAESCYLSIIYYIWRVNDPYSINECSTIGFEGMEII